MVTRWFSARRLMESNTKRLNLFFFFSCLSFEVVYDHQCQCFFCSYYSTYGHAERLVQEIKKGAESVDNVPEILSGEALQKMRAPPKRDVLVITPAELVQADGFIFGFPTKFGMMAAQFKAFLDSTGGLWKTQALVGKTVGIFCSTVTQGGGQETTALTNIKQQTHHVMIFVPIGYTFGVGMSEMEKIKGVSPYGLRAFVLSHL